MPTKTTVNYTPEMTAKMVDVYTSMGVGLSDDDHEKRANVVKALAKEFDKKERSIRSKLSSEKVYIKRVAVSTVTGEATAKKEVLAERLMKATPFQISADSVEKMNKDTIQAFLTYFNNQVVEDEETTD